MTITLAGRNEVFDVEFAWRPDGDPELERALVNFPNWIRDAIERTIGRLREERDSAGESKLTCMLCASRFKSAAPALLAVIRPAMSESDGGAWPICGACASRPNAEERVIALVKATMGLSEAAWGRA